MIYLLLLIINKNVSNCNNYIVDCSDESRHTCITVDTSHSSDITVNRSISDSNDISCQ
jgi:hypothetical protein